MFLDALTYWFRRRGEKRTPLKAKVFIETDRPDKPQLVLSVRGVHVPASRRTRN